MSERKYHFETLQLHVGQGQADPVTDSAPCLFTRPLPTCSIYAQHAADRFDLKDAGNIYGRLTNTTEDVFDSAHRALENGVARSGRCLRRCRHTIRPWPRTAVTSLPRKPFTAAPPTCWNTLPAFGVTTTFVDAHHNLAEVEGCNSGQHPRHLPGDPGQPQL